MHCFTSMTPEFQPGGFCLWSDMLMGSVPTNWTDYVSVLYDQFSRFHARLQWLRLLFFKTCLLFN